MKHFFKNDPVSTWKWDLFWCRICLFLNLKNSDILAIFEAEQNYVSVEKSGAPVTFFWYQNRFFLITETLGINIFLNKWILLFYERQRKHFSNFVFVLFLSFFTDRRIRSNIWPLKYKSFIQNLHIYRHIFSDASNLSMRWVRTDTYWNTGP